MTDISIINGHEEVSHNELVYAIGSYFWISTENDEKHLCALVRVDLDRVALIHVASCTRFAENVQEEDVFDGKVTSISKIAKWFKLNTHKIVPVKYVKIVVS